MSHAEYTNIHRYLDEAFTGLEMTADLQDLKEEIRSNLAARVAELQTDGTSAEQAAATAIEELGDVQEIIGGESEVPVSVPATHAGAFALNKVTPRSGFVIGAVLLSLVAVAALLWFALVLVSGGSAAAAVLSTVVLWLTAGILTTWSLRQETSQNYPVPRRRALGYGASSAAAVAGLTLMAMVSTAGMGLVVAGAFVLLGSVVGFIKLGISQTNRKKPWIRAVQRDYQAMDRFSQDPVAAARFGIYTAVIWIIALALFVLLSFTVGFAFSWLALLGGLVVFMVVLARMLFPAGEGAAQQTKQK
ncbi:permease prefix domain 1-containing protein [Arthrobacter sp. GMC3]|uniref:permease prefix domain 1-containing protein n=1 Tax=Arthrobacter sp. GMC3 TaxID=2058894 RepID=UPI000CE4E2BA|nr:permease prefix domain 1-containing protein [Arthrobacter sp. GMC3]